METTNLKAYTIGKFYRICNEYADKFKRGGNQKLQKIIGEKLFYKAQNGQWYFANKLICEMQISELEHLTSAIMCKLSPKIFRGGDLVFSSANLQIFGMVVGVRGSVVFVKPRDLNLPSLVMVQKSEIFKK
jgi:hypothetical protein